MFNFDFGNIEVLDRFGKEHGLHVTEYKHEPVPKIDKSVAGYGTLPQGFYTVKITPQYKVTEVYWRGQKLSPIDDFFRFDVNITKDMGLGGHYNFLQVKWDSPRLIDIRFLKPRLDKVNSGNSVYAQVVASIDWNAPIATRDTNLLSIRFLCQDAKLSGYGNPDLLLPPV